MRVLHVVPTYLPAARYGGPIYSVHGLCAGLARRGHDVHVYTTNVDGIGESRVPLGKPVKYEGVNITYFATAAGRRLYRSPSMRSALRENIQDFDISHLHSVFLWPTTVAAGISRRANVPYVLSPRGMLVPELIRQKSWLAKMAWIELFERRNLRKAAAVHVTAEIEARDISKLGLHVNSFATIPNGVDPALSVTNGDRTYFRTIPRPIVFYLGRLSWKKGLDILVLAMAGVPTGHLVIAGNDEEGCTSQLKALAREHGIEERTHFLGPLYGAEKWRALAAADLFVLPSKSENFGIAVLESMASAVPIIVTPEVGLAREVSKAGAGLVVERDQRKLAAAITDLLATPERRRQMGDAGQTMALKEYSWDVIAARMELLYAKVRLTT